MSERSFLLERVLQCLEYASINELKEVLKIIDPILKGSDNNE